MHDLTFTQQVLAVVAGGFVGFSLGLIGGGGSILAVPLLLYLVGLPRPHLVIGTTALAVAVTAYLNLIPHALARHVHWRHGMVFALTGAVAAFLGARVGQVVSGERLLFLFALLMLVVAALMVRPRPAAGMATERPDSHVWVRLLLAALFAGLLSGFFGIGGGFLIVPALVMATGMSMIDAIGTSLFSVGTFGLSTALSYALSGQVDWIVSAEYVLGGVAGGWLGARLAGRLAHRKRALNILYAAVITLVALYMLYRNLGGNG